MTISGAGGVTITSICFSDKFKKQYKKQSPDIQQKTNQKLHDLLASPMPKGLKFEKLKGYDKPDIYTIHITGNYKISLEIIGNQARLRRIGNHNNIDRTP